MNNEHLDGINQRYRGLSGSDSQSDGADEAHRNWQAYLQQVFHLAATKPDFLRRSQALLEGDLLPLFGELPSETLKR